MACGTPVIASNSSSIPEVVGDAGILVDPCNEGELAHAIYNLSTDGNLRSKLSRSGLQRSKLFTWERTAKETIAVYNEVLDDKKS
jgi:glycosyltransferase involved in cell wall biosynthesis